MVYSPQEGKCVDRNYQGRLQKLFALLETHKLDASRIVKGIWPRGTAFLDREGLLWHMAVKEAGLDPQNISNWGLNAPKYPASYLKRFKELNRSKHKIRRYNFQGAGSQGDDVDENYLKRKTFLTAFVKKHFSDRDFFRWTDLPAVVGEEEYKPLGSFDFTRKKLPASSGFVLRYADGNDLHFDDFYFGNMAQSEFTLAPGGDGPCSLRFYEAIASGSIPLVPEADAPKKAGGCWSSYAYIPYRYATEEDMFEYSDSIVEENFRLLRKYQTFEEGDLIPPGAENYPSERKRG
eukprot:TRINITY_DN9423_c2_g1_i3.p1 TRINITY_DN9423_c2_g1~~TRINITY_DN9423_c2_g1_i3.p1  ORF type:complete len:292 (+),score=37.15 TRINITY_DN9423_c2_g1_i3:560-1435(+)